jgi:hypothetical protein
MTSLVIIGALVTGVVWTGKVAASDLNALEAELSTGGTSLVSAARTGRDKSISHWITLPTTGEVWGGDFNLGSIEPCKISPSALIPGVHVKSSATAVNLFQGGSALPGSALPQHIAWSTGGRVVVKPAQGTLTVDAMDQPWLLAWYGKPVSAERLFRKGPLPLDLPLLIVLQHPAQKIEISNKQWTLHFSEAAGSVVVMPLRGLNHPSVKSTAQWSEGLPAEVAAEALAWARRLRRIPVGVKETHEVIENGVKITETFQYEDIDDAWQTPKQAWAFLPPIFGLAKVMGGPIKVAGPSKDLPWLGNYGALTVVDGQQSVTFTIEIPQLKHYLWEMAEPVKAPAAISNKKQAAMQRLLRKEIDKILEVNEHMAPFRNNPVAYALNWHWGNPGETVVALCSALPFLEPAKQKALKAYIRREFEAYPPLKMSFAPINKGARREAYRWDPPAKNVFYESKADPRRDPQNLYAVWQYVKSVGGDTEGKQLWPEVKGYFNKVQYAWDAGEVTGEVKYRQLDSACSDLNARLNGYLGYTRLARLAGDKEAEDLGTCLLLRGLAVKYAHAYFHQYLAERELRPGLVNFPSKFFVSNEKTQGYILSGYGPGRLGFYNMFRGHETPYIFLLNLSPEVGQFLFDHAKDPVEAAVRYTMWNYPGMWFGKTGRLYLQGEWFLLEPWIPWANFLGLSLVVQPPADELANYVSCPRAKFGDLYYIQKLALTLRAYSAN